MKNRNQLITQRHNLEAKACNLRLQIYQMKQELRDAQKQIRNISGQLERKQPKLTIIKSDCLCAIQVNTQQWQINPSQLVKPKGFDNQSQTEKKTRRKLWGLAHKLHCPVIGTCLVTHELEKIANKAKAHSSTALSEYDIHVSFVAAAEELNALSLATHKFLGKCFSGW